MIVIFLLLLKELPLDADFDALFLLKVLFLAGPLVRTVWVGNSNSDA